MTSSSFYDDILIRAKRGMGATRISSPRKTRGDRVWKGLTASGSAFVKKIPGAGVQHPKQLAGQMAYVNGKAKGTFGFASGMTFGEDAFEQAEVDQLIAAWSQDWQGRPRNGHTSHMVVSFPEHVTDNAAFAIAQEWCAEMFESRTHIDDSWEYIAALHTDTDNPHVHIILNNRGVDGKWFSISSEGVFNPQMMRDRMTDIADVYGVQLESLTRVDKGLYRDPVSSAAIYAEREGRVLAGQGVETDFARDWRVEDMHNTAMLYTTLADFAETIGAPMIAKRAHLSAAALFAGQEVPTAEQMSIDLDVTADREDIRTSLISWAEQNKDGLEALPDAQRQDIMQKIDAALRIIEEDAAVDLTEDIIWTAYQARPSSYLIPDMDRLENRASLYADEDNVDLVRDFMSGKAFDAYLVTGEVDPQFAPVMPAIAEAYHEMHNHTLADIPAEMKKYVRHAANTGLDPDDMRELLINTMDDPAESRRVERRHVKTIMDRRGVPLYDEDAFESAVKVIEGAAHAAANYGTESEEARFKGLSDALTVATQAGSEAEVNAAWGKVSDAMIDLVAAHKDGALSDRQAEVWTDLAAAIYDKHNFAMRVANVYLIDSALAPDQLDDDAAQTVGERYAELKAAAEARNALLISSMKPYMQVSQAQQIAAYLKASEEYETFQLDLGKVERTIIDNSKVYNADGLASVMQEAADNAATTGTADLASAAIGRAMVRAFVALEGKAAMQDIASGNMDPLAEYVDTPANRRLVARELLKGARQVDVGLDTDQIENGLAAVDPDYIKPEGWGL